MEFIVIALSLIVAHAEEKPRCHMVLDIGEKLTKPQRLYMEGCTFGDGLYYTVDGNIVTIELDQLRQGK